MARASVRTSLPLDTFARIIGYSPILFNGVYINEVVGKLALQEAIGCSDPILQYTWQAAAGGAPGREEMAEAIALAESAIEQQLKFPIAPKWIVDEDVLPARQAPSGYGRLGYNSLAGAAGSFMVRTNHFHFIQGGREAWSLLQSGAGVAYTDDDGDGYKETATVQVSTTLTDPDEICVYYPASGLSSTIGEHNPEWEIRPVKVSIDTTIHTATITFRRYQAVIPALLEALSADGVDGMVDGNFLASVDVYRHYNDPSQAAIIEWMPSMCTTCSGGTCEACQVGAQTACVVGVHKRVGTVALQAATWDADAGSYSYVCPSWWRRPDRVRMWYRAGIYDPASTRPMHSMRSSIERVVALLGLTYIDRDFSNCETLRNLQSYWKTDLALRHFTPGESTSFQVSKEDLDNPFGTTRAAVRTWQTLKHLRVGQAVLHD